MIVTQDITVNELVAQLKQDATLNILFVEGLRDLSFWRKYVPVNERVNCVVYAANVVILSESYEGGEKGKLLKLIELIQGSNISNRVKVFVDADNDSLVGIRHKSNVVTTDYRDLESYGFNEQTLSNVVHIGLAKGDVNIKEMMADIESICIPIGYLRFISLQKNYHLSFAKTFENSKRKKYLNKVGGKTALLTDKLITTLLQNSGLSISEAGAVQDNLSTMMSKRELDARHIIQGKDWIFYLSFLCGVDYEVIEPLIFVCIEYNELDSSPNILSIKNYLLNKAA